MNAVENGFDRDGEMRDKTERRGGHPSSVIVKLARPCYICIFYAMAGHSQADLSEGHFHMQLQSLDAKNDQRMKGNEKENNELLSIAPPKVLN